MSTRNGEEKWKLEKIASLLIRGSTSYAWPRRCMKYRPLVTLFSQSPTTRDIFQVYVFWLYIFTFSWFNLVGCILTIQFSFKCKHITILTYKACPPPSPPPQELSVTLMCPFSNHTYASFPNLILFRLINYWLVLICDLTVSGLLKIKLVCSVYFHRVCHKILAFLPLASRLISFLSGLGACN